jgi:hypothetical protein
VKNAIDNYIVELESGLCGPERERAKVVAEIRDGLLTAAEEHVRAGLQPSAAANAARSEFGQPSELAEALRPELAGRQSRRIALKLLATGPLVGALWAVTAIASHLGTRLGHSDGLWTAGRFGLAVSIVAATAAAALCLLATGRLIRLVNFPRTFAPAAAGASVAIAAVVDGAVLAALLVVALAAPNVIAWAPALVAAVASSSRLLLAARAAGRCRELHRLVEG